MDFIAPDVRQRFLRKSVERMSGQSYCLLSYAYGKLGRLGENVEKEQKILELLCTSISARGIDFHELMKDPVKELKKHVTEENVFEICPIAETLGFSIDHILLHLMTDVMKSQNYEDYAPFMSRLLSGAGIASLMQHVVPRLSQCDQVDFLSSVQRFGLGKSKDTGVDLMRNGLSQLLPLMNDPFALVKALIEQAERLGKQCHKLAKTITERLGLNLREIHDKLMRQFLESGECSSVLFVVVSWDCQDRDDWLRSITTSEDTTYRQKAMAHKCLAISTSSVKTAAERLGSFSSLVSLTGTEEVDLLKDLLTYRVETGRTDLLLELIEKLMPTEKRFLMALLLTLNLEDDVFFNLFVRVVSGPFEELISNDHWTPHRPLAVIRDAFTAISRAPRDVCYLIIDNWPWTWEVVVSRLCLVGAGVVAAELGGHLVCQDSRNKVFGVLMSHGHFDEALDYGFSENEVFESVLDGKIDQATEAMMDGHFVALTMWLKERELVGAIRRVEEVLAKQGRTMELKRMRERLSMGRR
jgi:hypothetical protein